MFAGAMKSIVIELAGCFSQFAVNPQGHGMQNFDATHFFYLCARASSMEAKHDLFWTQADFGYVKDIVDSTMKLCKPKKKVRLE